ncbi:hypothetical protein KKP04_03220 [Rhodomicrobium sp. Az07]|uniref:hypothetical protein n=1 Tax=Rhodomicrobium sp. Az07 TaxID=2839034 RepID=UPI001BEC13DF|nr:hypothetical protein [Rhodomicrobium sp. Az07]MBT3069877.1 hypothetical protein [Rhodomicrobium sp. Az07]
MQTSIRPRPQLQLLQPSNHSTHSFGQRPPGTENRASHGAWLPPSRSEAAWVEISGAVTIISAAAVASQSFMFGPNCSTAPASLQARIRPPKKINPDESRFLLRQLMHKTVSY